MEEQQGGETGLPKDKKEGNQVEERKEAKEAKEKAANNSKQSERDASKQENTEQSSRKGSFEGSEAPKLSGRTNSGSFDRMQKNGSLDSPRDRSGSCGSSVSSNGSSTSSAKSSASSNGSSKKVVVVRSAPITIGKIEKKRADSPRSPPVVPPIPEDEEEELSDFVCASGSKKEERVSFIKKLRRSSLTFRESLRRRLSTQSIEEMKVHGRDGRGEKDRRSSTPPLIEWEPVVRPTMARRQSTIGVIVDSEFRMGRSMMERSSSGDRIGRSSKTGVRRGSITEEARAGSWAQQDPWLQCKFTGWRAPSQPQERTQYWKLPGVP